jgi:hypothetical protein
VRGGAYLKDDVRKWLSDRREIAGIGPTFCAKQAHRTLTKAEGGLKGSFKLRLAAAYFRLGESATSRAEN